MDGVLVDTEPLYIQMNKAFLNKHDAIISDEEYNQFIGIHAHKMWQYLKDKFNLSYTVEELIVMEKQNKYTLLEQTNLVPIAGVVDVLETLKTQQKQIALASSSMRKNIELILTKTKLKPYFDYMVSGEEVQHGKPAPDIFLKAMNHFRQTTENCIVIEDAKNGVLAAKAANMYCIGFQNIHSGNQDLSQADKIVSSIKEITALLN